MRSSSDSIDDGDKCCGDRLCDRLFDCCRRRRGPLPMTSGPSPSTAAPKLSANPMNQAAQAPPTYYQPALVQPNPRSSPLSAAAQAPSSASPSSARPAPFDDDPGARAALNPLYSSSRRADRVERQSTAVPISPQEQSADAILRRPVPVAISDAEVVAHFRRLSVHYSGE